MERQQLKERHVVIDWSDVKWRFLSVVGEGKPWPGVNKSHHTVTEFVAQGKGNPYGPEKCAHRCQVAEFKSSSCPHQARKRKQVWNPETKKYDVTYTEPCKYCVWAASRYWEGGSHGQTLDNLRNGYRAPEFEHSAAYVPLGQKKRPRWNEEPEGDLEMSRLYGGYDDYYLVPADEEKKPGIRIMVEFAFACGVSNSVIEQYGAWVAGFIGALEATGYDLEVDMWIPLDGLFTDRDYGHSNRDNVLVRVKRQIKCSSGLGMTLGGQGWDLDYDSEDSILRIRVDQRGDGMYGGNTFPRDTLNAKAVELGLIPEAVA